MLVFKSFGKSDNLRCSECVTGEVLHVRETSHCTSENKLDLKIEGENQTAHRTTFLSQ